MFKAADEPSYVGIFHLYVKEYAIAAFKAAVEEVLPCSAAEDGVVEFQYLQDREDPSHFVFFDIYRDEVAYQAHLKTSHLARFGGRISPLLRKTHEGSYYYLRGGYRK